MATVSWLLDEFAHAGGEHLDAEYVAGYDRKAATDPSGDLAVLGGNGPQATGTVVDFGAGTGTFALAAAPLCRRVVAVDVSPAMLAVLRANTERLDLRNVESVQAGFLSYQHQGEPADVVYSRNALHHLPDFWKALALERLAAILRPGGLLRLRDFFFSCNPGELEEVVEAWLGQAAARPDVGWTRAELETHLREEYSTFCWLLEPMLERAGFAIRDVEHHATRVYATYTCEKR
jgi:SAM-dependent methyltransferase